MAITVIKGFSVAQMRAIAESLPEPKRITFVDSEYFEVETPDLPIEPGTTADETSSEIPL